MKLNTAERYLFALLDVPVHEGANLSIAADQTKAMTRRYDAPHKMQPTPPRNKRRPSSVLMPRLFRGYRP